MELNFDRFERRSTLEPREAKPGSRDMADFATPAGEGGGIRRRDRKDKILPNFQFDRLEARVLKSGPTIRASSGGMDKAPQLFLYGIDSPEPIYAWDPKKAAPKEQAQGPSVPFRLREATLSLKDMTSQPCFNRITMGDPELGAATQQVYTD